MNTKAITVLICVAIFLFAMTPVGSDDLFMCLALGRRLVQHGEFGPIDPFLFTIQNYHWHVWHEWLAYLAYFGIYSAFSMSGVILLKALLVAGAGFLVVRAGTRAGLPAPISALIAAFAYIAASPRIGDRASLFSDMLTCMLLFFFVQETVSLRLWKFLPLIFLLWIQLHPAFPVGLIILFSFFACSWHQMKPQERKAWLLSAGLSFLILLVNPLGFDGAIYPVQKFMNNEWNIFREINSEWQATLGSQYLSLPYKIYLLVFLSTTAVLATGLSWRRKNLFPALAAGILIYLSLSAVRFLALGGFGAGILAVTALAGRRQMWSTFNTRRWNSVTAFLILLGIAWSFHNEDFGPRALWSGQLVAPSVPVRAAEQFMHLPPGNIFNEYDLGGLLVWTFDERMKIAAHGHIDSPALVQSNILRFSLTREDFEDIVIRSNVEYFFVHRQTIESQPLAGFVRELNGPRWRLIYEDSLARIYQRQHASN